MIENLHLRRCERSEAIQAFQTWKKLDCRVATLLAATEAECL
jgi:hypothetical protein